MDDPNILPNGYTRPQRCDNRDHLYIRLIAPQFDLGGIPWPEQLITKRPRPG